MNLFLAPLDRGWLIVRPVSHAVLFLDGKGDWVDTAVEARIFENRLTAMRAARNVPDASVMHANMANWLKPPLMTVKPRLVSR